MATTSWISTSRRVPLNVTPICGASSPSGRDHVRRALDVEERRHLRVRQQPHRVLIEPAVALAPRRWSGTRRRRDPRCRCLPSPTRRNRRRSSSAPGRGRAARPNARRCGRGIQVREPAVADLLAEHAQRVVLAEELLRRVVGILAEPVHHDERCAAGRRCRSRATGRRCPRRCRGSRSATVVS